MPVFSRKLMRGDINAFLALVMDAAAEDESGDTQIIAVAPFSMNTQPGAIFIEVYQYCVWYLADHEIGE